MEKIVKKRRVPPAIRNYNRCVIKDCIYHTRRAEIRVYKFPDDAAASKVWCDLVQLPISDLRKEPRVCGLHFTLEDRHSLYCRVTSKPHNAEKCRCNIRDGVAPSLNLPSHKPRQVASAETDVEQLASPEFISVKQENLEEFAVNTEDMLHNDDTSSYITIPHPLTSTYDDVNSENFIIANHDAFDFNNVNMPRPLLSTYDDINVNNNITANNDDYGPDINDVIMPCPLASSYDDVMEPQDLYSLCRICAQPGEQMEAIFGPTELHKKINFCLPNEVCESDRLPLHVCRSCVAQLSISFELATQSQRADVRLRMLLQRQIKLQKKKKKEQSKRTMSVGRETLQMLSDNVTDVDVSTPQQDTPLCPPPSPNILQLQLMPSLIASSIDKSNSPNSTVLGPSSQNLVKNSILGSYLLSQHTTSNVVSDSLGQNSLNVVFWPNNQSSSVNPSNNFQLQYNNNFLNLSINSKSGLLNQNIGLNTNNTFCNFNSSNKNGPQNETSSYNFSNLCKVELETDIPALMPFKKGFEGPFIPEISLENSPCSGLKTALEDESRTSKKNLKNESPISEMTLKEGLQTEIKVEAEELQDSICETIACEFCLKTFVTKQERSEHMKLGHTFMCIFCNFSLHDTTKTIIDNHYIIKHSQPLVQKPAVKKQVDIFCNKCLKIFKKLELYNNHICRDRSPCVHCHKIIRTSVKNSHKCIPIEFKCEICNNILNSKVNLKIHIQKYHNLFLCRNTNCFIFFKDRKSCETHYSKVHNVCINEKYTCNFCGIVLTKQALQQHILAKHSNHTFNCHFCDKKYMYKTKIFDHMFVHLGDKQFQCEYCSCKFYNKTVLGAHIKHKHTKASYFCDCGKVFLTKIRLSSHIKAVHDNHLFYHCKVCSQGFGSVKEVLDHFNIHKDTNVKTKFYKLSTYQCNICLKFLKNKMYFKLHMRRHEQGKGYLVTNDNLICDICSKVCSSNTGLEIHLSTHNKELKFPCNICNRKFPSFVQMKAHHKFHFYKKNREYFCDGCGEKFRNKDMLEKHVKQVCFPNRLFL